jgi:hypothetical protein
MIGADELREFRSLYQAGKFPKSDGLVAAAFVR